MRTFGDLRLTEADDDASALPPERRYSLLVTASDVSRHRFVRLPWDYPLYGLVPDEQEVADAVRASASIPFFFEPVTLRSPGAGRAGACGRTRGGKGIPPRRRLVGDRSSARGGGASPAPG